MLIICPNGLQMPMTTWITQIEEKLEIDPLEWRHFGIAPEPGVGETIADVAVRFDEMADELGVTAPHCEWICAKCPDGASICWDSCQQDAPGVGGTDPVNRGGQRPIEEPRPPTTGVRPPPTNPRPRPGGGPAGGSSPSPSPPSSGGGAPVDPEPYAD